MSDEPKKPDKGYESKEDALEKIQKEIARLVAEREKIMRN